MELVVLCIVAHKSNYTNYSSGAPPGLSSSVLATDLYRIQNKSLAMDHAKFHQLCLEK